MARSTRFKFLLLILCLGAASVPAQEPELVLPPLTGFSAVPPPAPNSLGPPPVVEWEPLASLASGGESSPPPLPGALLVPPLEPAPVIAPDAASGCALFVPGGPNPQEFQMATPEFEIWRTGAETPEIPTEIKEGLHSTLIASGDPILVRLLFDPSLTGTEVAVTPSKGVTIQPAQTIAYVGPSGECLFTVALDASQEEGGEISFYSQQITTALRVTLAPPEVIEAVINP